MLRQPGSWKLFFPALAAIVASSQAGAQKLAQDLNESVTSLDVSVRDLRGFAVTGKVVVTQFKPDGDGPFPIMILNHGRGPNRAEPPRFRFTQQVRYFVNRGFAVFEPTRIGYGEAGIAADPEDSGPCNRKNFASMAEAASTEILAVLDYAKKQAYVDPKRVLIVGQSVGGYSTVAVTAKQPPGLLAAINFAGGSGGDPVMRPGEPCDGGRMAQMYARFGETAKAPMLWIYTENDQYFGPSYSLAWHAAFMKFGGQAEFKLLPPFEKDGHSLFGKGNKIWEPIVTDFLEMHGFSAVVTKTNTQEQALTKVE